MATEDRVKQIERLIEKVDAFLATVSELRDDVRLEDHGVELSTWTAGDFRDFFAALHAFDAELLGEIMSKGEQAARVTQ
jgi:hypothetical protein